MNADNLKKLRQQFLGRPAHEHPGRWNELWQQNVTPWDRNGPSLALRDAITGHRDLFGSPLKGSTSTARKRALVPGCGRGYDVLLLASLGYDVLGLDASQTALEAAQKHQAESSSTYEAFRDPTVGAGEARFMLGDFFKDDFGAPVDGSKFDVIFDYTFLCALPPESRPRWAARMSELLSSDGHLVCLEWPLRKDPTTGGPPHGLSSALYERLFQQPGEEVQYGDDGFVASGSRGTASPSTLERVAHYMPEKTHDAGKDSDYISIWKHAVAV